MATTFEKATNLFGDPISDDSRKRIQRFLNRPSTDAWDDIYGILVTPHTTVWQAVLAIDPSFPAVGRRRDMFNRVIREWPAIPLPLTVMRAIKEAVGRDNQCLR